MPKIRLGKSKNGKSVFANKDFKEKEVILIFKGNILDYDDIDDDSYEDHHCIQLSKRKYLGPSNGLDDYVNHSCDPNSGIRIINKKLKLVAIKPIKKGEEITWDYSTYMAESHWTMRCKCGSKSCRKKIKDFKHLPVKLKREYKKLKIIPRYILEKLNSGKSI